MHTQTEFSNLREQSGLSIDELSDKLGFSARTLYRWDRGETEPREAALHVLRKLAEKPKLNGYDDSDGFTFIDLFAGIGGLRKGFEPIGGRCVFTSERDQYPVRSYTGSFPMLPCHR